MIEIIGCILLIIIGVSFICMSVMLDKLEGTCQDCIYLEKIKPLFEKLEKENKILRENAKHNDKVVDKVNWENMLLKKENKELKEKFKATNKGLQKVVLKRKKWKYRYQLARCKIKELERIIELCHLDAKETLATINYEQEGQQKGFINYLQKEINQYASHIEAIDSVCTSIYSSDYDNSKIKLAIYKEILQKYREIVNGTEQN